LGRVRCAFHGNHRLTGIDQCFLDPCIHYKVLKTAVSAA
jgi:hypothetical protein